MGGSMYSPGPIFVKDVWQKALLSSRCLNQLDHQACRWRVANSNPIWQQVPGQMTGNVTCVGDCKLKLEIVTLNWRFLARPEVTSSL